ncbi:vascular non-inflammatory molecule 3-like isoform X2 [Pomacea canaliculata]|uniref:vascular non-inflammatory molecule 3-like isoform X2 n=1 Tax=Pomacea canaliculata TaxID=400727 RepID=UPI000D7354B5|nr:vascular non-inflammatory molecule 3-like isoform X2 [Pomacea canaliculata]
MEHGCLARMQMTGMRQLAVPGCLMLITVLALAEVKQRPWTYRASVFAHRPLLPSETFPVSRTIAVKNMMKNVVIYRQQAQHAAKQGAQIIVYPEDGLYGYLFNRVTIKPYLEPIPDPWQVLPWVPCTDPGRVQPSDIMVQLSCIARENKIYLVANMGDIKPCNTTDDVSGIPCPPDGHFQYNTDVVFDPTGRLIARYHKHNLCEEHQFDKPEVEVVTFETPFGRFGLFTCFDILFHDPAILLVENGITNIAFPTFWTEEYPLLNAIGIHSPGHVGTV